MNHNDLLMNLPSTEGAIEYNPLTITPNELVVDAIALMSQARGKHCLLQQDDNLLNNSNYSSADGSCVLVIENKKLLGIFTERDIVRLTAIETNFAQVKIVEVMAKPIITLNQVHFQDIFAALFLFRRYRIRHLPIVDNNDNLVGLVTPESIRQILKPANLLKLRRVSDVMTTNVAQASMSASIKSLAQSMATKKLSCIVITEIDTDERIKPVGIITERDIVQFQSLELNLSKIQAQDVMSTPLFLLNPDDSLWTAHQEMQQRHIRRLVVSWNWGRGLGIITQTSLLRVFDPVEMYNIVESFQQSTKESNNFAIEKKLTLINSDEKSQENQEINQNLTILLRLQKSLESLLNESELKANLTTNKIKKSLADVMLLKNILS